MRASSVFLACLVRPKGLDPVDRVMQELGRGSVVLPMRQSCGVREM